MLWFAAPVGAKVHTQNVAYRDGEVELEGYLAYDDAQEGRRPGILIVHEWWGLNDYARGRARQLAALGYVAFAVDMYGKGKVTKDTEQAGHWSGQLHSTQLMRRRAQVGLQVLVKNEHVDASRIAAIGYCFGGGAVLQLAYGGADLIGVVSFHGTLPVPTQEDVANIKADILVCHGAEDPFVPAERLTQFKQAMAHAKINWQLMIYPNAQHSFTNPAADHDEIEGTAYNEQADKESWQQMLSFFNEIFAKEQ